MKYFLEQQDIAYTKIRNFTKETELEKFTSKIITAPTQVGKTASIIELLKETSSRGNWMCSVSCDNKTDQLNQIFTRFNKANLNVFVLNSCKKRNTNKIIKELKQCKSVVVLLLNNASQIYKLTCLIKEIKEKCSVTKYLSIHDEGDTLNKIEDAQETQIIPESHKEWELHFGFTGEIFEHILRVHVTATYENCSNNSRIQGKDIVVLPTPPEYRTVTKHIKWESNEESLRDSSLITYEIERINTFGTGEVILYCYTSLIKEQLEQAELLYNSADCITVVYNSGSKCVFGYSGYSTFTKSINEVLTDLKATNKAVVVFGNDLMGRGISFTGNGQKPLAATVLFHKDSSSTTAVNITQKFGRITGTARPDIKTRTLYCTDKAYKDYQNYLENQKAVYCALEEYPELTTMEILKIVDSRKLHRKVDRVSLKKTNKIYKEAATQSTADSAIIAETVKMKRLIKSWKNKSNVSEIAKLFRRLIENKGKLLSIEVKKILEKYGDNYYNNLVAKVNNRWDTVFYKENEYHYIKKEAMEYYNSL